MTLFLYVITCSFLTVGMYCILGKVIGLPSGKAVTAVKNIHGKKSLTDKLQTMLTPFSRFISKLLPMSEFRCNRLEADFLRLSISQTPEEYVSTAIAKALLLSIIGLLFILLGVPWITLLTVTAAVLSYFREMQSVRKKVEILNREIEAELPRMVETLNYSLQDNRDLLKFFEKYRKVSGKALGKEIDRLIIDMKTGNQEAALRSMEARLGLPSFSALCAILCGVHQGVDQQTSLLVLEQDLRTKERESFRRNMERGPKRIKTASFILTVLMILMFMVPLVQLIFTNLRTAGF